MNESKFEKLKVYLLTHKITVGLILAILVILFFGSNWALQKFSTTNNNAPVEEVDLLFDSEGPYAQLYPRRDGNALVLNIKRTSSYDSISYDLSYTSTPDETVVAGNKVSDDGEGDGGFGGSIDRGVSGTIDTKDKKGEYEQEILFGTCSKNVCKYDKGVENGTLILHIRKGQKAFRMITQWHLQKPDVALGSLSSGDGHFIYKVDASRQELNAVGFSIINDLTGVAKLPSGKKVVGKAYALNVPLTKELKSGDVVLELAENPGEGAKLYRYSDSANKWEELDTKIEDSKFSAKAAGAGIFAVLSSQK